MDTLTLVVVLAAVSLLVVLGGGLALLRARRPRKAALPPLTEPTTAVEIPVSDLGVAVDSPETVDAAARAGIARVLIDVDVGLPRCGCRPEDAGPLADLARRFSDERIDYSLFDTGTPLDYALFRYLSDRQRLARTR